MRANTLTVALCLANSSPENPGLSIFSRSHLDQMERIYLLELLLAMPAPVSAEESNHVSVKLENLALNAEVGQLKR
jgi:hypothetical protein